MSSDSFLGLVQWCSNLLLNIRNQFSEVGVEEPTHFGISSGIQTSAARSGMDSYNVVHYCVVLGNFAFPLWARVLVVGACNLG